MTDDTSSWRRRNEGQAQADVLELSACLHTEVPACLHMYARPQRSGRDEAIASIPE